MNLILIVGSNLAFLVIGYLMGSRQLGQATEKTKEKIVRVVNTLEGDNEDNVYIPPSEYYGKE